MFNNKSVNPCGLYSLIFYPDGKKKEIVIDDYFPCYSDRPEPIFSKSNK